MTLRCEASMERGAWSMEYNQKQLSHPMLYALCSTCPELVEGCPRVPSEPHPLPPGSCLYLPDRGPD